MTRQHAHHIIKSFAKDLELDGKIATHTLRKTYAKKIYDSCDGNLFICQKALRHEQMNSTVNYIETTENTLNSVIYNLDL